MTQDMEAAVTRAAVARVTAIYWEAEAKRIALKASDSAGLAFAERLSLRDLGVVLALLEGWPLPATSPEGT